jgi:hypothetical protein
VLEIDAHEREGRRAAVFWGAAFLLEVKARSKGATGAPLAETAPTQPARSLAP